MALHQVTIATLQFNSFHFTSFLIFFFTFSFYFLSSHLFSAFYLTSLSSPLHFFIFAMSKFRSLIVYFSQIHYSNNDDLLFTEVPLHPSSFIHPPSSILFSPSSFIHPPSSILFYPSSFIPIHPSLSPSSCDFCLSEMGCWTIRSPRSSARVLCSS